MEQVLKRDDWGFADRIVKEKGGGELGEFYIDFILLCDAFCSLEHMFLKTNAELSPS